MHPHAKKPPIFTVITSADWQKSLKERRARMPGVAKARKELIRAAEQKLGIIRSDTP